MNPEKKKPLLVEDQNALEMQDKDGNQRLVRVDKANRGTKQATRDGQVFERSHNDDEKPPLNEGGPQTLND